MNIITRRAMLATATTGLVALGGCHPAPHDTLANNGKVEERLARLEQAYAQNAEALDFLRKVYEQQKAQQQARETEEAAEDAVFAVDIAPDIKAGQVEGSPQALVTIVEAWDFACPFCRKVSSTLEELTQEYHGNVRVVFKNMVVHPQVVMDAHKAGCAAAKQGKFVAFKNAFWEKAFDPYASTRDNAKLGEDNILAIAHDLGLDTVRLKADMTSAECEARIQDDMEELLKFHVNATPSFFINGKVLGGALPKEEFKKVIDEELKLARASGVPGADYYEKVVFAKGEKQFRSKKAPKNP